MDVFYNLFYLIRLHFLYFMQGTYMQLQSFFSILQVIGSLFIGILIDKIGSRGM